jgi:hypothetical protein
MRSLMPVLFFLALFALPSLSLAGEVVYEGVWHTTNRKLDGPMTCRVTRLGHEQWQGRFYGVWQGVPFDYTVRFSGPATSLRGTATIDGADYVWTGAFGPQSPRTFRGTFGGTRYEGYFALEERKKKK